MTDSTPAPRHHPAGFYYIFFGEFAERCCYYGMRTVLLIYLANCLELPQERANSTYSIFKASCYLLPLLGGFLADRYFGKYWTIVGFSVPYVVGQLLLGLNSTPITYLALGLLACGSGVIKPNISTLMGQTYDQKRPGQTQLRSAAFQWFYFSINVGALLSMAALPIVRDHLAGNHAKERLKLAVLPEDFKFTPADYAAAYPTTFMLPAVLMVMALGAFAAGKRHYALETPGVAKPVTPAERTVQLAALRRLLGLFLLMTFFWVAYEHNDSLWVLFAKQHMDLKLSLFGRSHTFAPDGLQWVNSLCVLLLIPFFNFLWPRIDPAGTRFPATRKMLLGFLVTAAAAGFMAILGFAAAHGKVSGWWLIVAYVVLTIGEVLIYGTGLELAFAAAPDSMKGFVTACYLLTNTLGNLVNSLWVRHFSADLNPEQAYQLAPGPFFLATAAITFAAAIAFHFVGQQFNKPAANAAT
jgi:dipeptide/tripeptide permease